jgi:hypothetical protein
MAMLAIAAGFAVFMSLGAKKFDRYALPVFPLLALLAGLGLAALPSPRAPVDSGRLWPLQLPSRSVLALTIAVALVPLVLVYPRFLAYYNPLLGGGPIASRLIPVGEGEGLKEAAEWLNERPGSDNLTVVSHSYDALKANLRGGGETLRDRVPASADYVVIYMYQTQIEHGSQVLADYAGRQPEHVITINGIDYVRIYRGPHRPAGA